MYASRTSTADVMRDLKKEAPFLFLSITKEVVACPNKFLPLAFYSNSQDYLNELIFIASIDAHLLGPTVQLCLGHYLYQFAD